MTTYERIKDLCDKSGTTIKSLEKELGMGNGTIAYWKKGSPKSGLLSQVADYFGVTTDYLLGKDEDEDAVRRYVHFYDKDISLMAQEMKVRPELRVLFDASKKLSKDDIQFVIDMIERMK